jgi:GNAT superfamily N-acetyltransferase
MVMWTFTSDIGAYAAVAEQWLLRDPVRNTVPLTVLSSLRAGLWADDVLMGWLEGESGVSGAMSHTPPYPLLLGDVPVEAVPALAAELIESGREVSGVSGPLPVAEAFAAAWWRPERGRRAERLYRLDALVPPDPPVPGTPRVAEAVDAEAAVEWFRAFQLEATVDVTADPTPVVHRRISRREIVWWEAEGRPVSLAAASTLIVGMSRVGPVYTPPDLRGRGYGSAVTHAVTRKALDEGASEVLLFTDLDNPASNSVYQRLGYRPVADYVSIELAG